MFSFYSLYPARKSGNAIPLAPSGNRLAADRSEAWSPEPAPLYPAAS
jgi:hypothetical protein